MLNAIVFLSVLLLTAGASDLQFFEKCKKNDPKLNKCLTENANKGWAAFVKAKNLEKLSIDTNTNIPNFIDVKIKGYIAGFDNIQFNNIYVSLEKQTVDVVYSQPKVSVITDYDMIGYLVGVDVSHKGFANTTFVNGIYKYHFNYDVEARDKENYIKITTFKLSHNVEKIIFKMDSNENKERGRLITTLFNNNWRVVNILADEYIGDVFSEGYTPIIQEFFNNTSVEKLFAE